MPGVPPPRHCPGGVFPCRPLASELDRSQDLLSDGVGGALVSSGSEYHELEANFLVAHGDLNRIVLLLGPVDVEPGCRLETDRRGALRVRLVVVARNGGLGEG